MYTYDRRTLQSKAPARPQSQETLRGGGMPNSAMRELAGERGGIGDLAQRMQNRLPAPPIRPQAQIPRAEAEADRLSAGVQASSPEGVKADLGRRMGADFTNVRFHTDAAAAARAESMGARAFTSGADVYFGQGGFDPGVAAHELVHTAQQGMVDSAAATMSTPVGGVQMKPGGVKEKVKQAWDTAKGKVKGAASAAWSATGGRLIRKNHDAVDELHEAMKSGEWDALTEEQQNSWKRRNPAAYAKYMRKKDDPEFIQKVEDRLQRRAEEQDQAAAFLAGREGQGGPRSMIADDSPAELEAPASMTAEEGVDLGAEITDDTNTALGIANGFQSAVGDVGENITGGIGGGLGIVTGGYGAFKSARDTRDAWRAGDKMGVVDGVVDTVGNLSNMAGGALNVADALGAGGPLGMVSGALGIVNGGISIYQGSRAVHEGRMKSHAMEGAAEALGDRENLQDDALILRDAATQGKMESTRQKIEGAGQIVTGGMDIAASALSMAPGSPAAYAGAAMGALSGATKLGFAGANAIQKNRMKKKVVEQTSGITDETITAFQMQSGIKDRSRAKQALMKAMGYTSGTRAELYADQTEKRGAAIKRMAEDATHANNAVAVQMAEGLGAEKDAQNGYDAETISKGLGLRESRSAIASRAHRIHAMKASNDRAAAAAAAQNAPAAPAPAPAPAAAAAAPEGKHKHKHKHHKHKHGESQPATP